MLTNIKIAKASPRAKQWKLYDSSGLYLLITPAGGKWWRHRYRIHGKEKGLSLGTYPQTSLKEARAKRDDNRQLLRQGIDPSMRQSKKDGNTFESVAREWHTKQSGSWSADHATRILSRLERDVFPWLGTQDISEIDAPEILSVLRRMETRGLSESAHRVLNEVGRVFRYAVAIGCATNDPTGALRGALPPIRVTHHAAITKPQNVGNLLRAIDCYHGHFTTCCALRLLPLVFVRPGELRNAEWSEIDGDEWRIPAEKTKMKRVHIVPLSRQARAILDELRPLTGHTRYVFPGAKSGSTTMSENTINNALRKMGFAKNVMTGHGFRSMATTLLNEQGWRADAVERQMAHVERNSVRAAYNYAEHLPERREMMQVWADYLDAIKAGGDVVPFRAKEGVMLV